MAPTSTTPMAMAISMAGLAYMAMLTASMMARKVFSRPLSTMIGILSSISAVAQPLATREPRAVSSTQAPVAIPSPMMASTA
ncbi:hypothetical protein D3C84_1050290 [compost metagenome]